jgi:outer membrane protein assembly factor BamC
MLMTDRFLTPSPRHAATLALALLLGGCTLYGDWFGGGDKYKDNASRTKALDVPPDLTQLSRDSRYLPQGGVVTASDLNKPGAAPGAAPASASAAAEAASGPARVALASAGEAHLEHQGDERFVTTKESPEQVWNQVHQFWLAKGFTYTDDNPQTGVLQTDWQVDKRSVPSGFIANAINRVFSNLPDAGLRDRYRTRIERRPDGGSNIYVTHFGASEELVGFQKSETQWVPRPSDPQLEAEMLSEMMLALGGVQAAPANVATATAPGPDAQPSDALIAQAAQLPSAGPRDPNAPHARIVADQPGATLQVDDDFDHTWRRVGLALDHGGFTVEDRDRAQGLYFVRFVNAREAAKDEPGVWARIKGWFGKAPPSPLFKYRISIKSSGNLSTVTILNDQGQPDASENPQAMIHRLAEDLK